MDKTEIKDLIKKMKINRPIQVNWAVAFLNTGTLISIVTFYNILPMFTYYSLMFNKGNINLNSLLVIKTTKVLVSIVAVLLVYKISRGNCISRWLLIILYIINLIIDCFVLFVGTMDQMTYGFYYSYYIIGFIIVLYIYSFILLFTGKTKKWFKELKLIKNEKLNNSDLIKFDKKPKTPVWPILSLIVINISGIFYIYLCTIYGYGLMENYVMLIIYELFVFGALLALISFFRPAVKNKVLSFISLILCVSYFVYIGVMRDSEKKPPGVAEINSDSVNINVNQLLYKCRKAIDPDNNKSKIKNLIIISGYKSPKSKNIEDSIIFNNYLILFYQKPDKILFNSPNSNGLISTNGLLTTYLIGNKAGVLSNGRKLNFESCNYKNIKKLCISTLNSYIDPWKPFNTGKAQINISRKLYKVGKYNCYKILVKEKSEYFSLQRNIYIDNKDFLLRMDESSSSTKAYNSKNVTFGYRYSTYNGIKLIRQSHSNIIIEFSDNNSKKTEIKDRYDVNRYIFNSDKVTEETFDLNENKEWFLR